MSVINTNINSLVAQQAGVSANRSMSKAMEQLSTGKRINGAADDAAGLAIANKMTSQIRGLDQAVRNANDGISMIQTAEGSTKEVSNMLQRMRELGVQALNGTNTTEDKAALQSEFSELQLEITRISNNTEWNGMKIGLTGGAVTTTFQVGANSGQTVEMTFKDIDSITAVGSAVATGLSASSATVLGTLDDAIKALSSYRADMGAKINRLTYTADNLANISTNTSASRSRIEDTDYAQATTELARSQIIQQAATAMLAQANQAPQNVLSLLR
jgi:flagellin